MDEEEYETAKNNLVKTRELIDKILSRVVFSPVFRRWAILISGNYQLYFKVVIDENSIKFICLDVVRGSEECVYSVREDDEIEYVGSWIFNFKTHQFCTIKIFEKRV